MPTSRFALIRSLFDEYIELYAARDERLFERYSANFSGYTGGGDVLVTSRDQWIEIVRQDFAQVPNRIRIEMLDVALQDICDHAVVVTAFFRIHLPIPDRILSRETARLVVVFRLEGDEWKVAHSGISIPYHLVQEGEVYPLRGLAERNSQLEAQVECAQHALAQSETRFRSLVESLSDVLFVLTADGTISYLSPQWRNAFGYEVEESVGQSFVQFIHPDDRAGFFAILHQFVGAAADPNTSRGSMEFRVRCKDRCFKPYVANVSRRTDPDDGHLTLVGIGRDVSDAKKAAAALVASEMRFRNMVDTTDGIVWEADAQTFTFTFISQKAERLLGFPVSDWLEPGFWVAHLHPDDLSWAPQFCASCTGRLEPHDFEYRFIAKDGHTVWLRDIVTVVAENGQPRWLRGVMVDISAQKQIEAELNETETHKMLEDAQQLARLGGWKFETSTGKVKWSKEVYHIYGLPEDFDPSDAATNIGFFYPEDCATLTRAFNRAIEHGEPYDLELRLIRPDGRLVWVRTLGKPQLSHGRVMSVAGNILDITERKLAEEEIRSLAFYDPLTQLPNRRLFFDRLNVALAACARRKAGVHSCSSILIISS